MSIKFPFKTPKTLYLPEGILDKSLKGKNQGRINWFDGTDSSFPVYFNPFNSSLRTLQRKKRTNRQKQSIEEVKIEKHVKKEPIIICLDSPDSKGEAQFDNFGSSLSYQNKQVTSDDNLEILKNRNVLIEERDGQKFVINSQGKEFVYYENLEEVRKVLRRRFPGMSKDSMYKELLKPYRHQIVDFLDSSTHTMKQIYQWGYEGWIKQFNKTWNLVDHLRMHEGIKPYKCHIWEKFFTQKGNLQKHLKQHVVTDVQKRKKFKCTYWGKGYTERYNCTVSLLEFSCTSLIHGECISIYSLDYTTYNFPKFKFIYSQNKTMLS